MLPMRRHAQGVMAFPVRVHTQARCEPRHPPSCVRVRVVKPHAVQCYDTCVIPPHEMIWLAKKAGVSSYARGVPAPDPRARFAWTDVVTDSIEPAPAIVESSSGLRSNVPRASGPQPFLFLVFSLVSFEQACPCCRPGKVSPWGFELLLLEHDSHEVTHKGSFSAAAS